MSKRGWFMSRKGHRTRMMARQAADDGLISQELAACISKSLEDETYAALGAGGGRFEARGSYEKPRETSLPKGAMPFAGMKVLVSPYLTEPGEPVQVPRTWKERLLSRPWRPWKSKKWVVPEVHGKSIVMHDGTLIMHPATAAALEKYLGTEALLEEAQ